MDHTAILFPGQGSQTDDMRERVERDAPELIDAAVEAVGGEDPFALANESTRYAQPAIYCSGLAGWSRLGSPEPGYLAGHSLGELTALAAAGSVSAEEGLRLVALRGELMERAGQNAGAGGMLALIGGEVGWARELARELGLSVANDNAPDQVVLSGDLYDLDAAQKRAEDTGVRATRLRVSGAFHSPAMEEAREAFERELGQVSFAEPEIPVMSCATAEPFDDVPRRLAEAITSPVRWRDILLQLRDRGVTDYIETGPGKVLTGLVRRTLDGANAQVADRLEPANA